MRRNAGMQQICLHRCGNASTFVWTSLMYSCCADQLAEAKSSREAAKPPQTSSLSLALNPQPSQNLERLCFQEPLRSREAPHSQKPLPFQELFRCQPLLRFQKPPRSQDRLPFQASLPSTRLWPDDLLRASSRERRLQAIPVPLPRPRGRPELRLQPLLSSNGCRGTRS